jgi:uncharacterized Zn-finger protein
MTGNPSGKVRGKRIFAAADEVPPACAGAPLAYEFPRKFMQMGPEAGLFLKKAF